MLQHPSNRRSSDRVRIQQGHNQIARLPTRGGREEPVRTQQCVVAARGIECRRRLGRTDFGIPLGVRLKAGTPQQVFAKGKGPKQHGVQNHTRAPHIRLGAIVPTTALLFALRNDFGGHVVGRAHDRRHALEGGWHHLFLVRARAAQDDIVHVGAGKQIDSGRHDAFHLFLHGGRCHGRVGHPQRIVEAGVVGFVHDGFVIASRANRILMAKDGRETKVGNLEHTLARSTVVHQQILGLQITMRNPILVTIVDATRQFAKELAHGRLGLGESLWNLVVFRDLGTVARDQIKELASAHQLEDQEHGRLGLLNEFEDLKQVDDIPMPSNEHHVANLLGRGAPLLEPLEVLGWDCGNGNVGLEFVAIHSLSAFLRCAVNATVEVMNSVSK